MPERETIRKAKRKLRRGRAASTAAGEFVREEMHHVRRGKHGARSTKQAIAIGLSKARRAGVPLKPPKRGVKATTRASAQRAYEVGQHERKPRAPSRARGRAISRALRREPHGAATHGALSSQAHRAAAQRGTRARSEAARKAVRTKGPAARRAASDALRSMQLVTADHRRYSGAEAVFRTLEYAPELRTIARIGRLPVLRRIAELAYRQIAKHRPLATRIAHWLFGRSTLPPA